MIDIYDNIIFFPDIELDINNKDTIEFSNNPPNKLIQLGFNHYKNLTFENFELMKKNELNGKDFFNVLNDYEINVENFIQNTNNYFKTNNKEYDKDFFIFWEIIYIFDVIKKNCDTIGIININNDFLNYYKNTFIYSNCTYNIYNKEKLKKQADLFIINDNLTLFEQIENIIFIIDNQKKGGNLIFKIYDLYTLPSIKIIFILFSLYKECFIYKPLFSRYSDNDKYIICKNYKTGNKSKLTYIKKIFVENIKITTKFIIDIFPNMILPSNYINIIKFLNIKFSNKQYKIINEYLKYIKDANNIYGNIYHNNINKQKEVVNKWINLFFPDNNKIYQENKKEKNDIMSIYLQKFNLELKKFEELLF